MNDSLSLPFFTHGSSGYPPTPPFPDTYDSHFTTSQDEFYSNGYEMDGNEGSSSLVMGDPRHRSNGLPFPFPTPPATSRTDGASTFTHSAQSSYPPSQSSSTYLNSFYTNPAFLDVGLADTARSFNQPGPSFSRPSSSGEEYLQEPDDEDGDGLIKLENGEVADDEGTEGIAGDADNEEPLYVNAKQYHRILKRRAARQRLEELNRLARSRKPYLHESRHRHACSRPRGKGGRFLTAEEIEAMKKEEAAKANGISDETPDGSDSSRPSTAAPF